jgi:hypothetical protein
VIALAGMCHRQTMSTERKRGGTWLRLTRSLLVSHHLALDLQLGADFHHALYHEGRGARLFSG